MKFSIAKLLGRTVLLLWVCAGVVHGAEITPRLQSALAAAPPGESVPVIIVFDPPETVATVARQAAPQGASAVVRTLRNRADRSQGGVRSLLQGRDRNFRPLWIINALATKVDPDLIRTLAAQPGVQEVRLDETIRRPAVRPLQVGGAFWNLDATGARDVWNLGFTGTGVTVAIFDSGVDPNQPLLGPKWRGNPGGWFNPYAQECATSETCTPCEANGSTPCDDASGVDFGHGTAVAGIVLGGDGTTTTGVAPGANWIAAKIFKDNDTADVSAIHAAFQWALDPDGDPNTPDAPSVVNNSWGFDGAENQCLPDFRPDVQALQAAGIAVVFAGGNGGPGTSTSISPGNYPEDHAVGALEPDLSLALFSARGPSACGGGIYPGTTAPGVDIQTTALGSGLINVAGTSFSAPHLSGILALLRQAAPAVPTADLSTAALRAAVDLGPQGADNAFGFGLVDARAALNRVQGQPHMGVHDPVPPENDGRISFGSVFPGFAATSRLTVYNQGGAPLGVQVSALGGATPLAFSLENSCSGASLSPDGTCTIALTFSPATLGTFSGRLTITPSSSQAPVEVVLSGVGENVPTAPQLLSPADGARTSTSVTFRWLPGSNPDGQPVTDELMVSRDPSFTTRVAAATLPPGDILLAGAGGLLAALAVFGRRNRRRMAALLTALLLAVAAACGGGSGDGDDQPGVAQTVTGLTPGVTYFWKVTSRNAAGGTADSAVRSFTVPNPP